MQGAVDRKHQSPSEGQGRWPGELDIEGLAGVTSWGRHLRQREHLGEGIMSAFVSLCPWGRGTCLRAVTEGHVERTKDALLGSLGLIPQAPSVAGVKARGRLNGCFWRQTEGSTGDTLRLPLTLSCDCCWQGRPREQEPKAVAPRKPPRSQQLHTPQVPERKTQQ